MEATVSIQKAGRAMVFKNIPLHFQQQTVVAKGETSQQALMDLKM
jgi:hypothetical protein